MISIVKSLGAVLVEVLGDPKWTERLRDASNRYQSINNKLSNPSGIFQLKNRPSCCDSRTRITLSP